MEVIASAPGKTILFGEHSVVYSEPAIAAAVNKRATIRIETSKNNKTMLKSKDLGFEAELDTKNKKYSLKKGKPGIIRYILEALYMAHDHSPINIDLSIDIPIGSGLGSSAAVTVATLAALYRYHNIHFNKRTLAEKAHQVEFLVQGEASPLDTLVSTYGGLIYLNRKKQLQKIRTGFNSPFVVGVTSKYGSTGKMVANVKKLKQKYPKIVNPIIKSMGELTDEAKHAIEVGDVNKVGTLMNINHGLLDSIGVNTKELSRMVYIARSAGAIGSKITGAGGGGSIIALCPNNDNAVSKAISTYDSSFKLRFSRKGVSSKVIHGNGNHRHKRVNNNQRKNNRRNKNKYYNKKSNNKIKLTNNKKNLSYNKKSVNNSKSKQKSNKSQSSDGIKIEDNKVVFKKKAFKTINNKIDYSR
ncbi:MAG: mevalonate kinase [Methanobrevibacter wolinii]|nr:mevalonate kinase [Methanobrevibacter wolinii]MDD5959338.1 mevalonate kinase [Methanobrevibacter wolinii]